MVVWFWVYKTFQLSLNKKFILKRTFQCKNCIWRGKKKIDVCLHENLVSVLLLLSGDLIWLPKDRCSMLFQMLWTCPYAWIWQMQELHKTYTLSVQQTWLWMEHLKWPWVSTFGRLNPTCNLCSPWSTSQTVMIRWCFLFKAVAFFFLLVSDSTDTEERNDSKYLIFLRFPKLPNLY